MENIPLPEGFGWKVNQGELLIDWTDDKAEPDVVLGLMSFTCKKVCDREKCSCAANGISCTGMCKCKTCANKIEDTNSELIDFEEDLKRILVTLKNKCYVVLFCYVHLFYDMLFQRNPYTVEWN